jgi:soluble lytic murein transglycosylase
MKALIPIRVPVPYSSCVLFLAMASCHGGDASQRPPRAETSVATPSLALDGGMAPVDPLQVGMPRIAVVLDDPRLAAAREHHIAGDDAAAARDVEGVMGQVALGPTATCGWSYVAGKLHLSAGENPEAAAAFERVARPADGGAPCALARYASLREAEALVRGGQLDPALALARALGTDFVAHDEADLTVYDALVAKNDLAGAVALARDYLTAHPHGVRWVELALRTANALLDGVDGPAAAHAQEALDLATRVLVEAPVSAEHGDAAGVRQRAAEAASMPLPSLSFEERAHQAQSFLDASQPKKATETGEALLRALPKSDTKHRDAGCKAATVVAQASPHGKAEAAAKAWGVAIDRCTGTDALVSALYGGAKASASARRRDEAVERFGRVEKLFPRHRFADDARFRTAMLAHDEGDEAKYESRLASVADDYPDGDMKAEALFRLALAKLARRDTEGARPVLDRLLTFPPDTEHAWAVAGRAAYFRARVSQLLGDADDAKARYLAILEENPLAYYMLLAYGRLRALDAPAAKAALDAAMAHEPAGPFLTREHPEFATAAFERFARLLEVGEVDAARHEASAGGLIADAVDTEVLWTLGWMYDHAGAPELGHSFSRGRLAEYRSHYPAGRWKFAWQVAFPRPWEPVVTHESESNGIPDALTWAIMREESGFDPEAKSAASAVGLMQLMTNTARLVAKGTELAFDEPSLHRPEVSIAIGARLLGSLRVSFPGSPALAIAAYNSGGGSVRRWLAEHGGDDFDVFVERIPFDETRGYVKRVLASEAAYAYLYAPKAVDEVMSLPLRAAGQEMAGGPAPAASAAASP